MDADVRLDVALRSQNRNQHDQPFRIAELTAPPSIPLRMRKVREVKKLLELVANFPNPGRIQFIHSQLGTFPLFRVLVWHSDRQRSEPDRESLLYQIWLHCAMETPRVLN